MQGNATPYDDLKPQILKEVDDFKGESTDISHFFSQCKMHFSLFNWHFCHSPHKVIFCMSQFGGDAQKWWELGARVIRVDNIGEQLYSSYANFKAEVRKQFWKDADMQIKHAQWEKLRQTTYQDGDQFFQKFEELAYNTGVCSNEQVMLVQIKKATHETSKNTIYAADSEVANTYDGWKAHLLCMDYNYHLKKAEGTTAGQVDTRPQAQKVTMPQKGGQTSTYMLEKKTATGTTYRGHGTPMDIDAARVTAKCFQCGQLSHFKRDCSNAPKSREEAMRRLNYYWDMHPTVEAPMLATIEEVKDNAGK